MADKSKKPQKLKARLPRGLADRGPAEIAATRRMTETIREVFERYGFESRPPLSNGVLARLDDSIFLGNCRPSRVRHGWQQQ